MENENPQLETQPEQPQQHGEPQQPEQSEQPQQHGEQLQEIDYEHLQNWFLRTEINKILSENIDKTSLNNILDLGSVQGTGTAYFADNFLENENSTVTYLHPHSNNDIQYSQNSEFIFEFNISNCKNSNKITTHKISSDVFFENNTKSYNLIYIDGSHDIEIMKRDIEKSFQYLEQNGILWINNYNYGKETYDAILETYQGQYDIIHNQCELAIKKK